MPRRDLIVIGGSAGSLDVLKTLVRGLPPDMPAALCITRHITAHAPNILPQILAKSATLPTTSAVDGEELRPGHIYVAPPDHHLLVSPGHVRVTRSPTENRFRPAIDPLFRSAAVAYGPRVVGVILSGALDDGTAGLWAVKQRGGVSIVQDPKEALHPSMPQSAMTYVPVDYCLPAADIAPRLFHLVQEVVEEEGVTPVPDELSIETRIVMEDNALESGLMGVGHLTPFTCPECHGTLLQLKAGRFLHFRCHVGHAFSARSLLADLSKSLDDNLWSTLRALEESTMLMKHIAEHLRAEKDPQTADLFMRRAQEAQKRAELVRQMVMREISPNPEAAQEDSPGAADEVQ
jgi:two-component system, chemotaxis family, protein-glutamate methylesterase/glutaminase